MNQATALCAERGNGEPTARLPVCRRCGGALLGLVDQHDGDAISDRIATSARITDEPIVLEANWSFANRAREDFE